MTPPRLFSPEAVGPGQRLPLDPERSHYLRRVLRLQAGDALKVFDGSGVEYEATIERLDKRGIWLDVGASVTPVAESPLRTVLLQSLSRGDRMDLVVQKATELGATEIRPVISNRSVVRLAGERAERRREHWRRVAISACEQCGRATLPVIAPVTSLATCLAPPAGGGLRLVLSPRGAVPLNRLDVPQPSSVEVLIGPEGGFDDDELDSAAAAGFVDVRLGSRILRTETAGLVALALLQSRWGDL